MLLWRGNLCFVLVQWFNEVCSRQIFFYSIKLFQLNYFGWWPIMVMFRGPEGGSRIICHFKPNVCLMIRVKPSVTVLKPAVIRGM